MRTPACRVVVDGIDLTSRVLKRLGSLSMEASRADHADTVTMEFADTDGRLALPRKGVTVEIMLGFEGSGVSMQGSYIVDEVEHRGTPDVIHVKARSAKLASALRTRKERSWNDTTVAHIVSVIAGEHGLTPRVADSLGARPVQHLVQTESDIALLRRLGRLWDAVATVKAGHLLFAPIGRAQTVSGKALSVLNITRRDGDQHRFLTVDREAYTGIRARWHDVAKARGRTVLAGQNGHVKILRGDFASEDDAKRAAEAELARVKRGASTFELQLAVGRPDVYPEMPVQLKGWRAAIDAVDWIVTKASHRLDGRSGYTTSLELENKATAEDHIATDENHDDDGSA